MTFVHKVSLLVSLILLTSSVQDQPKILIIGDSISLGYTPFVKNAMQDEAQVFHNPGNAQHTGTGLKKIEEWIGNEDWDIIQFNWGLWDLCYRHPDSKLYGNRDKENGTLTYTVAEYAENLDSIVSKIRSLTNAHLIFVTTSYVPEEEGGRFQEDPVRYNKAALKVMKKYGIEINDVYNKSRKIHEKLGVGKDDVHFTEKGYEEFSELITKSLRNRLSEIQDSKQFASPYRLSDQEMRWIADAARQQLAGCRIQSSSGLWLHTPDGIGNYKALWTRDFYYMVEYAGDLLDPNEVKKSIYYLMNGQRVDGCIPDRVNIQGKPVYSPGGEKNPIADHALDNGPFMALLVCSYVNRSDDKALFVEVEGKLRKGLEFVNRKDGLVYNDPADPQCTYGFTDVVKKTGHLLFTSVLYYQACREMEKLCKKYKTGSPDIYRSHADRIKANLGILRDEATGMYWAADQECKQLDIWGSALAVRVGAVEGADSKRISQYLVEHADEIIMKGQVRHLPGSDSGWNSLFIDIGDGTYQNGAYWATPLAWIIPVIGQEDPLLAQQMLKDVIHDFQKNGINECINTDYYKIPNYVVSATNVYTLTK